MGMEIWDKANMLKHFDLFSGIGGFALAAHWAGFQTVGFVEIDQYCQKVLKKHWPNVPIVEDIHDREKIKEVAGQVNTDTISDTEGTALRQKVDQGRSDNQPHDRDRLGSDPGDIREALSDTDRFASEVRGDDKDDEGESGSRGDNERGSRSDDTRVTGTEPHGTDKRERGQPTVDLITGGFPCQPFSVAGKQTGTTDDRYLWPAMLNVIKDLRPTWVLAENVVGINNILFPATTAEMELAALQSFQDCDIRFISEFEKHSQTEIKWKIVQTRILDEIIQDLEKAGYEVPRTKQGQPVLLCIPACGVNAPHRRYRYWIVARNTEGNRGEEKSRVPQGADTEPGRVCGPRTAEVVGNPTSDGQQIRHEETGREVGRSEQGRLFQLEGTSDVADTASGGTRGIRNESEAERSRCSDELSGECGGTRGNATDSNSEGLQGHAEQPAQQAGTLDRPDTETPADSEGIGSGRNTGTMGEETSESQSKADGTELVSSSKDVADNDRGRCEEQCGSEPVQSTVEWEAEGVEPQCGDWWGIEPNVGRVAHGIPARVDRLKGLGNAIVPQVAYEILRIIAEIETIG